MVVLDLLVMMTMTMMAMTMMAMTMMITMVMKFEMRSVNEVQAEPQFNCQPTPNSNATSTHC